MICYDCHDLAGDDFIFQQDGAAYGAKATHQSSMARQTLPRLHWHTKTPGRQIAPTRPEPLDYHTRGTGGSYVGEFRRVESEAAERIAELKVALQAIWNDFLMK